MLAEMENLQSQIQQAKHATDINHLTAENLKRDVKITIFLYNRQFLEVWCKYLFLNCLFDI